MNYIVRAIFGEQTAKPAAVRPRLSLRWIDLEDSSPELVHFFIETRMVPRADGKVELKRAAIHGPHHIHQPDFDAPMPKCPQHVQNADWPARHLLSRQ